MYVDDIVDVCFSEDVNAELAKTRNICTSLLGSGAMADDKTESGRKLEVIGYTIASTQSAWALQRRTFSRPYVCDDLRHSEAES
jgi:hypothetical protein